MEHNHRGLEDHVPSYINGWFVSSMLIFQGVFFVANVTFFLTKSGGRSWVERFGRKVRRKKDPTWPKLCRKLFHIPFLFSNKFDIGCCRNIQMNHLFNGHIQGQGSLEVLVDWWVCRFATVDVGLGWSSRWSCLSNVFPYPKKPCSGPLLVTNVGTKGSKYI